MAEVHLLCLSILVSTSTSWEGNSCQTLEAITPERRNSSASRPGLTASFTSLLEENVPWRTNVTGPFWIKWLMCQDRYFWAISMKFMKLLIQHYGLVDKWVPGEGKLDVTLTLWLKVIGTSHSRTNATVISVKATNSYSECHLFSIFLSGISCFPSIWR